MQGLLGVSDWNCWLSACASLPFWTAKPFEPDAWADGAAAAEGELGAAGVTTAEAVADATTAEGDVAVAEAELVRGVTEDWACEGDGEFWELPLAAPVPEGRPEDETMSESCSPLGTGADGLAGQLPGGFRTCDWPKGIVPGWPALRPPVNCVGFTPWNWHWKTPLSSGLRGAFWQ